MPNGINHLPECGRGGCVFGCPVVARQRAEIMAAEDQHVFDILDEIARTGFHVPGFHGAEYLAVRDFVFHTAGQDIQIAAGERIWFDGNAALVRGVYYPDGIRLRGAIPAGWLLACPAVPFDALAVVMVKPQVKTVWDWLRNPAL